MLRLFIALHFPDKIKDAIGRLISGAQGYANGIKWIEAKNLHLTLKFLGDTQEKQVPAIIGGIQIALANAKAFEVTVEGCGGFPSLRNPRVIWTGISDGDQISQLAQSINHELSGIGIEKDKKKFSPHITLGRVKKPGDMSGLMSYLDNLNFTLEPVILNRIALVKSTLTSRGPIYENVENFKLF
ncbi:MAG: RNA 2',3'-cyclic phosphodiesterase [candidate division Zixibacteria bacterium]|nr:RNA 2',3'-cyclic phosphodiesterase [candidate division Zixibacteria bacterium]